MNASRLAIIAVLLMMPLTLSAADRPTLYKDASPTLEAKSILGNAWENAITGKTEWFPSFPPDNRLLEFLPQSAAAQNLYHILIEMGETPRQAFRNVHRAVDRHLEGKRTQ